jgi:hypothetical protein
MFASLGSVYQVDQHARGEDAGLFQVLTPMKNPLAERLLGAGFLGLWLQRHLHEHGGRDPRVVTKQQLVEAGAPLLCQRQVVREQTPSGSRAWMIKAGETRHALAEQGHKVTAEEKAALMRECAAEFRGLPEDQRARYEAVAAEHRQEKRRRIEAAAEQHQLQEQKVALFRERGFGVSSIDWPIDPAVASETMDDKLGKRPDGRAHGVSKLFAVAREKCAEQWVIKDNGARVVSSNARV